MKSLELFKEYQLQRRNRTFLLGSFAQTFTATFLLAGVN